MNPVQPAELVTSLIDAGESKIFMSTRDTLVRSVTGGALLSLAAAFAISVNVTTGSPLLGAMLFPMGLIMLHVIGCDLLTDVFVLASLAWLDKRPGVTLVGVLRNWGLVLAGNFIGAFSVAVLMAIVVTHGFTSAPDAIAEAIGHIGEARTLGYAEHGVGGMLTPFISGVLCAFLVSTGVVGALVAKDAPGKALVMWMPSMLFFFMGFEHSVVNMFLFPSGLLFGGGFTIMDSLVWNQFPTVLGNLVGGLFFTAIPLFLTHARICTLRQRRARSRNRASSSQSAMSGAARGAAPVASSAPTGIPVGASTAGVMSTASPRATSAPAPRITDAAASPLTVSEPWHGAGPESYMIGLR